MTQQEPSQPDSPDRDHRPERKGPVEWLKRSAPYAAVRGARSRLARTIHERGLRDTGVILEADELELGSEEFRAYEASQWPMLRRALRPYDITRSDVFADIGAGMGRVVWQAARKYPFGRVIGVEISERLASVARENLKGSHSKLKCRDVEVVTTNAVEYSVPDDLNFIYLFNPFVGETFDNVLSNLIESLDRNPRKLVIIYAFPTMREKLEATGRFGLVREIRPRRPDISQEDEVHWTNVYESH